MPSYFAEMSASNDEDREMPSYFAEMSASNDEDRSETSRTEGNKEQYRRTPEYSTGNGHSNDALKDVLSKLEIPKNGPYHVISISGGTEKEVSFEDSLKHHLLVDLKKIFSNERETLILTSGVDRGVVHYVGEALKNLEWRETQTTKCLGLLIEDKDYSIESPKSSEILMVKPSSEIEGSSNLNPQHTHFLLVKSRTEDFWFQRESFVRRNLLGYLAKAAANARDRSIVLLCVGGGIETIKEIADCLRCKYPIPIVLFKGSGGATDFVDYIISKSDNTCDKTLKEKVRRDIYDRVKSYRGQLSEEIEDDVFEDIETIFRNSKSYSTCNEHSNDALKDVLSKLEIPKDGPYHVISISGGTEKEVSFDENLKRHLLVDLKKIFSNKQQTLILTSGVDRGVVHYVGEALKTLEWSESKTTKCLGLLTEDKNFPIESSIRSEIRVVKPLIEISPIPNQQHSHFLLVKSRKEDFWFQKGSFIRQKLLGHLAQAAKNTRAEDRSIVLLCVGGGVETIKEIADCLRCKYPPVVLFKGSGGATDFVDDIRSHRISEKTLNEKLQDLCDRVKIHRGTLSEEIKNSIRRDIITISDYSQLVKLTSYDYRNKIHGAAMHDFNDVVRLAAETSKVFDESVDAKENIIIAINDVQSNRTNNGNNKPLDRKEQEEKMMRALRDENIRSIIGLMSEEFIATVDINDQINTEMKNICENGKQNIEEQSDIRLAKFINKFNKMHPNKGDSNQLSFRNIFLWAIETRRFDLAEFAFAKLQEDAIITSLVVSIAFRKVAETMPSQRHTENEKYMTLSREYERKATRLIEIAHEQDPGEVENILEHKHKHWRNFTCLKVAIRGKAKVFLSLDVCQKTLRKQWYGHIDTIHFEKTVMLVAPFYWLVACSDCIKVDISEEPSGREEPDTNNANRSTWQPEDGALQYERQRQNKGSTDTKMTARDNVVRYFKKCKAFYSSPIANFTSHCVSYVMFLLLYACVLTLSHLDSTFPLADFVAHVWILAILIEIARAMFNLYYPEQNFSHRKHFKEWSKFTLNRLAMAAMVTSIVAFLCRWFTATRLLGRICYGINYALFAFRILRLYSATKLFGPWVSMIKQMLFTTLRFTVIIMVFLVGYGVAIQALLGEHSGEGISFLAIRDIFYKPYFKHLESFSLMTFQERTKTRTRMHLQLSRQSCIPVSSQFISSWETSSY
ncbi:transient receptor potential cation channel subfamily M member 1-like [Ptychodera flava]|uniref:transient receptor potential cation channel subfamily M member 1-like n=1 Tax=Ptychodera flava TaxID=63121 RepID=UPI00396A8846